MSGPPAICSNPNCGWEGEIPNFFVGVKAINVTFRGGSEPSGWAMTGKSVFAEPLEIKGVV